MKDREIKGFTQNDICNGFEASYDELYKGKLVNIPKQNNEFYGVVEGVYRDTEVGEIGISLIPHIALNPDGTYVKKDDSPARVAFPFTGLRPLNGTIEEWVDKFNKDVENSKKLNSK